MLSIRNASTEDIPDIEHMVEDFVKGHPAEHHPRSSLALRTAYFGERPVAHLLVAERNGELVGMAQWTLVYDMFWGMFGAEAGWLYVKPQYRGSGIVAAIVARLCATSSEAGAQFLHGGAVGGPEALYERIAIGNAGRDCYVSGRAFQVFATLDGLPVREIIRRLPEKTLGLQPPE